MWVKGRLKFQSCVCMYKRYRIFRSTEVSGKRVCVHKKGKDTGHHVCVKISICVCKRYRIFRRSEISGKHMYIYVSKKQQWSVKISIVSVKDPGDVYMFCMRIKKWQLKCQSWITSMQVSLLRCKLNSFFSRNRQGSNSKWKLSAYPFQLLVLECYNENCLLSTCPVSIVGAGVLSWKLSTCLVSVVGAGVECYNENSLPSTCPVSVIGAGVL